MYTPQVYILNDDDGLTTPIGGHVILNAACRHNQLELCKSLLANKDIDVNQANELDETALHIASAFNNNKIIELLVSKGANINAQDSNGYTPLMYAIKNYHKKSARTLIELGADLNIKTYSSYTALSIAIHKKHRKITKLLLEAGADPNADPSILLNSYIGSYEINYYAIKKLIKHGVNLQPKHMKQFYPILANELIDYIHKWNKYDLIQHLPHADRYFPESIVKASKKGLYL